MLVHTQSWSLAAASHWACSWSPSPALSLCVLEPSTWPVVLWDEETRPDPSGLFKVGVFFLPSLPLLLLRFLFLLSLLAHRSLTMTCLFPYYYFFLNIFSCQSHDVNNFLYASLSCRPFGEDPCFI